MTIQVLVINNGEAGKIIVEKRDVAIPSPIETYELSPQEAVFIDVFSSSDKLTGHELRIKEQI